MLFLAPLLAIGYAAYSQPAQDDYEDYGGGGGYGGPARPQRPSPVQPQFQAPQRNPVQPQFQAPPPAAHGGGGGGGGHDYDQGYDVAEEWKPYSFSYSAQDPEGGSHSHQQQADSRNRVTGQYSIMGADGRMRTVKYVADENGFRAEIVTNEQGTESKNPADVTIQSSAQTGEEAAKQYGNSYSNSRYDNYATAPQNRQPPPAYGGGAPAPPPSRQSFSNQQSYTNQNSQSYSHHNNQGYSQGNSDYKSTGYSSSRGYNQDYNDNHHAAAPAPFPRTPGGSYGNDISDIEEHEDKGYYSGTGSRGANRSPSAYGR